MPYENSNPPIVPTEHITDIQRKYEDLFKEAVKAVNAAGGGLPQTHDELIAELQVMAIPQHGTWSTS